MSINLPQSFRGGHSYVSSFHSLIKQEYCAIWIHLYSQSNKFISNYPIQKRLHLQALQNLLLDVVTCHVSRLIWRAQIKPYVVNEKRKASGLPLRYHLEQHENVIVLVRKMDGLSFRREE